MINYIIKKSDNKLYISKGNDLLVEDIPFTRWINGVLISELSTFKAREKTTRKLFSFKSKIPIYIDNKNLLMTIKSYRSEESVYINYFSIYRYEEKSGMLHINFHNGHVMKISEKYAFFEQLKKCRKIIDYITE